MNKQEAKFWAKAKKWLEYNLNKFPTKSFKIEAKVVRLGDKSFYYPELTEKEERLLLKAKHKACVQTNSDFSRLGTPCDADVVSGGGWVFIKWTRRANKTFYIIDIDDFINHRNKSSRKSLTEEEAQEICYLCVKHK